jgi:prepilin-type N-terminal cleavage/methylation domain-containing protein
MSFTRPFSDTKSCKGFTLSSKLERGFTLIELLIVIAILGVLASLVVTTFPAAQKRARDAQRQNDIKQYQTAVEKYANSHNGQYYNSSGTVNPSDSSVCTTLTGSGTLCSKDPKNTSPYTYKYNGTLTGYVIWAQLEYQTTPTFFVVCSTGQSGLTVNEPSSTTCTL